VPQHDRLSSVKRGNVNRKTEYQIDFLKREISVRKLRILKLEIENRDDQARIDQIMAIDKNNIQTQEG